MPSRSIATRSAGVPGRTAKARPIDCGMPRIAISARPVSLVASDSSVGSWFQPGTGVRLRTSGRTAPRSTASWMVVASAE